MELGHLLTRSGLTYPEVSSKVSSWGMVFLFPMYSFAKMDLQEVGGGRGDWMELAVDRDGWRALVGTVRNFRVP